jgi:CheY-like chemotaxis protein
MTAESRPGILVVDDDAVIRRLLQLALEQDGFQVWAADGGRKAIDLYTRCRQAIAVVLLDIAMPDMDGPATYEALRQMDPDVRACFMSGNMGDHDPEELMRRGARRIFTKPFALNDLANALWSLTNGAEL